MLTTAAAMAETALGPDHPDIVIRLGNLAATYSDLGRPADALEAIQLTGQCALAVIGMEHPTTLLLQRYANRLRKSL